jgi:hypothetical protein
MGKGQIIASAIMSLSIIILVGYALGDFAIRASGKSSAPEYGGQLNEVIISAEKIKSLISQERSLAIDTALFYVAGRGGYGENWKGTSVKQINKKFIPEKEIPYYDKTDYAEEKIPDFSSVSQTVIDMLEKDFTNTRPFAQEDVREIFGDYFSLIYSVNRVELEENSNVITVLWEDRDGIPIRIDADVSSIAGGGVSYTAAKKVENTRITPFQALYSASKEFVLDGVIESVIDDKSQEIQAVESFKKIGEYCTHEYCLEESVGQVSNEMEFYDLIKGTKDGTCEADNTCTCDPPYESVEEQNSCPVSCVCQDDNTAKRLLYCELMKDRVGCNDNACDYDQISPCLLACFDYHDTASEVKTGSGCKTPPKVCEQECKNADLLGQEYQFKCVCDDWEPSGEGWICSRVGWYSKMNSRVFKKYTDVNGDDYYSIINPFEDAIENKVDADVLGFTVLRDDNICVPEPYQLDMCCTRYLTEVGSGCAAPADAKIDNEGQCSLDPIDGCTSNHGSEDCITGTITNLLSVRLSNELEKGYPITTSDGLNYYAYNGVNWDLEAKLLGMEESEISLTGVNVVSEQFYANCKECENGDPGSITSGTVIDYNNFRDYFAHCASTDKDICDCYESYNVFFSGPDGGVELNGEEEIDDRKSAYGANFETRMIDDCLYHFFKKVNPFEFGASMDFRDEVDTTFPNVDNDLVLFDNKPCETNLECDYDLGTNLLQSICAAGVCVYCDSSLNNNPSDLLGWVAEDVYFKRYFCTESRHEWNRTTEDDGTKCWRDDECIVVRNKLGHADYPLESLCVDSGEVDSFESDWYADEGSCTKYIDPFDDEYYQCDECQDPGDCGGNTPCYGVHSECPTGSDGEPCPCYYRYSVPYGYCKKCGPYESSISLKKRNMQADGGHVYQCISTEWVELEGEKNCHNGIDDDYFEGSPDGADCKDADGDCNGQYCGETWISDVEYCATTCSGGSCNNINFNLCVIVAPGGGGPW